MEPLRKAKPPTELQNAPIFELTNELKVLQAKMSNLFMHQKSRGGIIDVDAEGMNIIAIDDEEHNSGDEGHKNHESSIVEDVPTGSFNQRSSNHQKHSGGRNHRQVAAIVKNELQPQPKVVKEKQAEDEEVPEERHRHRHNHHHDHHGRRGGNRHNRRRQYHNNHSATTSSSSQSDSANGQLASGSNPR